MLKVDKFSIDQLASTDEGARLQAASELDSLEIGHFEDHPVSPKFVEDRQAALVQSHSQTRSAKVRKWVVQLLAEAGVEGSEVAAMVKESLQPHCVYLPTLLYYVYTKPAKFHDCKEKIRALYQHPDDQVRWRCALVLNNLPLEYECDIQVIRCLMTESFHAARTYAVLALKKMGRIELADREALRAVLSIDDGAARTYAEQMLAAEF